MAPILQETLQQRVIALERQVRESQNVVNEKEEEFYELNEKAEDLVSEHFRTNWLTKYLYK